MAEIGDAINAKLLATSGVSSLCGARGYPDVLPQNATLPAFAFQAISDIPSYDFAGESGIAMARVQITCFANHRKECNQLSTAIRTAISGQQFTSVGTHIRQCHIDNNLATQEQPIDGNTTWRYMKITDYQVFYK